jgi:hypothetical protein
VTFPSCSSVSVMMDTSSSCTQALPCMHVRSG